MELLSSILMFGGGATMVLALLAGLAGGDSRLCFPAFFIGIAIGIGGNMLMPA